MSEPEKWRGDLGLTDLIDKQDVPKFDLRIEVLGQLDEASSALGMVRACTLSQGTKSMILDIQRDLCWMMSDLAAVSANKAVSTHTTPERVRYLETEFHRRTAATPLGDSFVVPGDSQTSATLHLARSIVRRAERHVTLLEREKGLPDTNILPYLNRLSALLYVLARGEDEAEGKPSTRAHSSSKGVEVPPSSSEG
ncbi:MAG TPA: cob(I)yrinic acid a,c-diamide adenosyltransferase [Anaerolineales bacterium]|nr:cob(I)yrinic acid a,c-diamide adenosyltransferase [Anaerolineales bacterium]